MNKQIKLLIIICSFLLLVITGCEKKEMKESKKDPSISESYSLSLNNMDRETLQQIEQYGEIVDADEKYHYVGITIFGKEEEREKKVENIKKIEGVYRITSDKFLIIEPHVDIE